MGRILFLGAVAFVAFKYISRSNQRHLQGGPTPERQALRSAEAPELDLTPETTQETAHVALPQSRTTGSGESD